MANFNDASNVVAGSSLRNFRDFRVGVNDDDAIVRSQGNTALRIFHLIDMGDLIVLTDQSCFFVKLRDGDLLTPNNFNLILFDRRGSNSIVPTTIDGGVVFVETNGQTISAAILDGNVYMNWSVRQLSVYHNQLIKTPVSLCGPSLSSSEPEKYLFVVNTDGTMAAMSWTGNFGESPVGFVPWSTNGQYKFMTPVFGQYWYLVDRSINDVTVRYMERFDSTIYVDCALPYDDSTPSAMAHLAGEEVHLTKGSVYVGKATLDGSGTLPTEGDIESADFIGFNFVSRAEMWPVESLDSTRVGVITTRTFTFMVSVISTSQFQMRCNSFTRSVGGYAFGDPLDADAPLKTKIYRAPVTGRRDHNECEVIKHLPGAFGILYLGQEVQV